MYVRPMRAAAVVASVALTSCVAGPDESITRPEHVPPSRPLVVHQGGLHKSPTRVEPHGLLQVGPGARQGRRDAIATFRTVFGSPERARHSSILNNGTQALRGILAQSYDEFIRHNRALPVDVATELARDEQGRLVDVHRYLVQGRPVLEVQRAHHVSGTRSTRDLAVPRTTLGYGSAAAPVALQWASTTTRYDSLPFFFLEVGFEDPYWETDATIEERAAMAAGLAAMQADLDDAVAAAQLDDPEFVLSVAPTRRGGNPCDDLVQLASYRFVTTANCANTRGLAVGATLVAAGAVGASVAATVSPEPYSKLMVVSLWTAAAGSVVAAAFSINMHRECMAQQTQGDVISYGAGPSITPRSGPSTRYNARRRAA